MSSALFWDIKKHRVAISTDVSGQPISPIVKGQEVQELVTGLLF